MCAYIYIYIYKVVAQVIYAFIGNKCPKIIEPSYLHAKHQDLILNNMRIVTNILFRLHYNLACNLHATYVPNMQASLSRTDDCAIRIYYQ